MVVDPWVGMTAVVPGSRPGAWFDAALLIELAGAS
jgi:hypothetical protein